MNRLTFSYNPVLSIRDGKETIFVFQNPNKALVNDAIVKLRGGKWTALDCTNSSMPTSDAIVYLSALVNDIGNLFREAKNGRVLWNIVNRDLFIAQVRTDVLNTDFSQFTETTENSVLMKLVPIIPLLEVGMYSTSIGVINALPIDEYITLSRKQLWVAMLTSANAVL